MNFGFGYQQQQSSYSMRRESQQQSSYSMSQQGWHSNSDYQSLDSGLQVKPTVSLFDSQLVQNQARLNGGFGATRQDGWHGQHIHQNSGMYQKGGMHQSGCGRGSGRGARKVISMGGTNGFNSSSQFSKAALFDSSMGNTDFGTFEEVRIPASGAIRMQETRYERRSWGGDDGGLNYQHCFDNGGANWNHNGGYQSFEWVSKGI